MRYYVRAADANRLINFFTKLTIERRIMNKELADMNIKLGEMNNRLDRINSRMTKLASSLENENTRLNGKTNYYE